MEKSSQLSSHCSRNNFYYAVLSDLWSVFPGLQKHAFESSFHHCRTMNLRSITA
eukprot:c47270_g1_i1 orf=76-237(+)